jgi:hypothetical protein
MRHSAWLAAGVLLLAACGQRPPFADVVFTNGAVLTMDSANPTARAVAIRAGRILYVGTDEGAQPWIGTSTRVVDLGGKTLMPGFQDAHVHPISSGLDLAGCDLTDRESREAVLARIGECAAALPAGEWLVGSNWALPLFPNANPSREALDSVTPGRPAYLSAADGHSGWANTEALRLAGITKATPDPANGRIERNAKGEPTGTLRESAMGLVSSLIPPPSAEQRQAALKRAMSLMNQVGITAFMEASARRPFLETYREVDRAGGMSARAVVSMYADPTLGMEQVDSFVAWRTAFAGKRVLPVAVKIFEDGVIEARTAAMLAPYIGHGDEAGIPIWPAERLDTLVPRLVEQDFTVHVHAIGDRAIRMALDALERAEAGKDRGRRRHQITHLEVIDPADIGRFASLGVVADFQALWAFPDQYIVDLTWPVLGPERSRWLYPMGSVAKTGAPLAMGSDWNVSSVNPLEAIQTAVTRRGIRDTTGQVLVAEEAVDLMTALRAYTLGSAWALGLDGETGSLREGKAADVIVLDADITSLPVTRIHAMKVLLTMLEGAPVHGSLDAAGGAK